MQSYVFVIEDDQHPRFAAQRESLGRDVQRIPSLRVTNMGTVLLLAFSERLMFLPLTQRFSLGGEAGMLVAFGD